MNFSLKLNPAAKKTWHDIGRGVNVLVIDDILLNPDDLRTFALDKRFHTPRAGEYYPGWVSDAQAPGEIAYFKEIAGLFLNKVWSGAPPSCLTFDNMVPRTNFAVFAVDQKAALDGGFVDQHVDGTVWLAAITYLFKENEVANRGTAFWRYKPFNLQTFCVADASSMAYQEKFLGLRFFDQLRDSAEYFPTHDIKELSRHIMGGAVKNRRLFSLDENENWELVKFIPGKYNRLVAYPASQFHSAVDESDRANLSAESARLTYNGLVPYPWEVRFKAKPFYQGEYLTVEGIMAAD